MAYHSPKSGTEFQLAFGVPFLLSHWWEHGQHGSRNVFSGSNIETMLKVARNKEASSRRYRRKIMNPILTVEELAAKLGKSVANVQANIDFSTPKNQEPIVQLELTEKQVEYILFCMACTYDNESHDPKLQAEVVKEIGEELLTKFEYTSLLEGK